MSDNLAYQEEYQEDRWEELINGEVVMMAPASTNHTFTSGNIYRIFGNYLHGKMCTPISDGTTVYLMNKEHFVPDFMVVCDRSKIKWNGVHGAPDLVVEVLSPSTSKRDRKHKKDVYAQCGVREYWIVSTGEKSIEQYFLEDGQLVLHEIYTLHPDYVLAEMSEEERATVVTHFKCSLFDDLEIPLEDVFYRTF